MTRRRRTLVVMLALAVVLFAVSYALYRPVDPRLVGRWTWSDRIDSNYPVVELRGDGTADHIPWGHGMMRTWYSNLSWWREGDQIVMSERSPPVSDFDSFQRWFWWRFGGRRREYRFQIQSVERDGFEWRSMDEEAILIKFERAPEL
jgi:hypothetical protein